LVVSKAPSSRSAGRDAPGSSLVGCPVFYVRIRDVINSAWDNNSYYHPRLLRALPARCERVLDVGCGKGAFAIRLAGRAGRVDAVDRSADMIEAARQVVPANVTCQLGDVAEMTLPAEAYDAITSISALHHMSLPTVLPRLRAGTAARRHSDRGLTPPA
jgi:2-polyprenyl-3-methyl-5-hydroxy-6-metoxy-1,4-benzoquinol methylase